MAPFTKRPSRTLSPRRGLERVEVPKEEEGGERREVVAWERRELLPCGVRGVRGVRGVWGVPGTLPVLKLTLVLTFGGARVRSPMVL